MKKILALAAIAAVALTGCRATGERVNDTQGEATYIRYVEVQTPHGTVPCMVYIIKGGLDCNWPTTD